MIGISNGQLARGEQFPSVRRLATDLGINLHTVNKTYTILCNEGYISMDCRKVATVSDTISQGEYFTDKITQKLLITAAEAHCRSMSSMYFIKLCRDCFIKASN